MDITDQLADRFAGDPAQHVEDGELDAGQGDADGHAVESVVELVDEDFLEQQIEVAGILAEEERLQMVQKNRVNIADPGMGDGDALRAVARAQRRAQEAALVAQQFQALDDHGRCEQLSLEHRLAEDFIQLGVAGIPGRCGGRAKGGSRQSRCHAAKNTRLKKGTTIGFHYGGSFDPLSRSTSRAAGSFTKSGGLPSETGCTTRYPANGKPSPADCHAARS